MSESSSQHQDFHELAFLPANDPARKAFEARIPLMVPDEQAYWLEVLKETDRLQTDLAQVPIAPGLERKLLKIPVVYPAPSVPRWRKMFGEPLGWKHFAACVLVVLAICRFYFWSPPAKPTRLDDESAARIAAIAVKNDQATTGKLDIASDDFTKVQAALQSDEFSFPPMILKPASPMVLLGGGKSDFDGIPAAFTRWKDATGVYTLYQFDGTKLGLPRNFLPTTSTPKDLWHGNVHYRVPIWSSPDGKCTWALVLASDNATDAFSGYAY